MSKQKKIKIPKLFKKELKAKIFEKKILKKIYIPADKDLIISLYQKNPEGNYILTKENFNKDEAKKLKTLAAAINKNKGGAVNTSKLGFAAALVILIIAFYVLFMNKLIEWGMEKGLEAIFNAKADVKGVNFEIWNAKISFQYLEVANESEPFKNLFELGKTEIALNSAELLKAKFVAQNIECQNIQWNTTRQTSGALAKKEEPQTKEDKSSSKKEESKNGFSLGNVDVNKVVEDNKTNLQSLSQYSKANEKLSQANAKWESSMDATKKNIADVSKNVDDVRKINAGSIKTAQEAQDAYNKINAALSKVDNLKKDVDRTSKDFSEDKNSIDKQVKDSQGSMDKDFKYLSSLIALPKGGLQGIAGQIAESYLSQKLGKLYFYLLKAKTVASSLKGGDKSKKTPIPQPGRRTGFNVPFKTTVYPNFLIENAAASAGKAGDNFYLTASLKDLSADADLWGKPATFSIDQTKEGKELIVKGFSDARSNAGETLGLEFQANHYPFEMKEGFSFLNARSIQGNYNFKTGLKLKKDNTAVGTAVIQLSEVEMDLVNKDDLISKVVYDAIRSTSNVILEISYRIAPNGSVALQTKSNIDQAISKKIGSLLSDMSKKYSQEIKDALLKMIAPELEKNKTLSQAFLKINEVSKGNVKDVDSLKAEIEKKKKEIDDQVNKAKREAEDKIKKEGSQKVQDATKNLPKLPGF